ncbi:MAG: hypothetical protein QOD39_1193, partial [Mycobacterium sp.]|nr:hypothetical protein [Mycobacterium sp.]
MFDSQFAAADEVAATTTIGYRRASGQLRIAVALRDRLPRVGALYVQGVVSSRIVSTITWRTQYVIDDEAIALIDAAIAARASTWGPLSEDKLDEAIDAWIQRHDPAALRHTQTAMRTRDFNVGDIDDPAGVTSVWGKLSAADAAVLDRRVSAMAREVCDNDPRTLKERRADALGALGNGNEHLACRCGSDTCPAAAVTQSSNVVVHVLADQSTIEAATAPTHDKKPSPAVIVGGGIVPAPLLNRVIRGGAKVRPIPMPSVEPEPHYRPSAGLAQFVRLRDLFCRFPGCDVPADRCDIDHT